MMKKPLLGKPSSSSTGHWTEFLLQNKEEELKETW